MVLQCACILILVLFSSLRPYKEARDVAPGERSYEWINISDVAVLTTLSLISVLSAPIDSSYQAPEEAKTCLKYIVKVLAYGPLVVLVALAYRVFRNRYPQVTLNCCAPQEDRDDLLPAMSETSVTSGSPRETPSMCDVFDNQQNRGSQQSGRGSRDSSRGSIRRNRRSQQNSKGSTQSNSGSQEVYRGGNPVWRHCLLRLKRIKNTSFVMNDTQERGGTFFTGSPLSNLVAQEVHLVVEKYGTDIF